MATVSIAPLFFLLCLAVAAFVVAMRGWRWRRLAIPPTCRACGYDVSQRPVGIERCSECGADLAAPRAIVTSRRVVNRWLAIPATLVGVVSVLGFASLVVQVPWIAIARQHVPIVWIEALARRNHGATGDPYRVEWQRREGVSPAFLDHLLDVQGDASVPWRRPLGDVLVTNFVGMTAVQRDRFVRQLFGPPTFRVRSPVRAGDPLPVEVVWPLRGSANVSLYDARHTLAARADAPAEFANRYWSFGMPSDHASTSIQAKDWAGPDLAPGRHRVSVVLRRQLLARDNVNVDRRTPVGPAVEDSATLDLDVLPPQEEIGRRIFAPEQADAIARAVAVHAYHWHDGRCFAEVRLLPAPIDRAFAVLAVIDGVGQRIGGACAKANEGGTSDALYVPLSVAQAATRPTLTIVLVGEDAPLAQTIDQQAYWAGRIAFADVPIDTFDDYVAGANGPAHPTTVPYRAEATAVPTNGP